MSNCGQPEDVVERGKADWGSFEEVGWTEEETAHLIAIDRRETKAMFGGVAPGER